MAQKITYIEQIVNTRVRWTLDESIAVFMEAVRIRAREESENGVDRVSIGRYLMLAQEHVLPTERHKVLKYRSLLDQAWERMMMDLKVDIRQALEILVLKQEIQRIKGKKAA